MLRKLLVCSTLALPAISFAKNQIKVSDSQTCEGLPMVTNFKPLIKGKCLGLVLDEKDVAWKKPRKVLFLDSKTVLVTDMGGWGSRSEGTLWKIDLETKATSKLYSGGDWTHGLARDSRGRILFGDTDKIMRIEENGKIVNLITGLPSKGSHPVSHFILDSNDNIILNVGAPSNDCSEDIQGTTCHQRDVEGEIRLYEYTPGNDKYNTSAQMLGRGLRNSMALYLNEKNSTLYQAENNLDKFGITEEFNALPMNRWGSLDFGWPFCYGQGQEYDMPQDKKKRKRKIKFGTFKNFCAGDRTEKAQFLIPAHASPLDMMVYNGEAHPEFQDKLLMTWHGHRRDVEMAMVMYDLDENGAPIFQGDGLNSFTSLVSGKASGPKEKLRPVGMTIDEEGLVWFMEDMSKALLVLGNTESDTVEEPGDDNSGEFKAKVDSFMKELSSDDLIAIDALYSDFYKVQTCTACHAPKEIPSTGRKALETFLNRGWLDLEGSASGMTFFTRMSEKAAKPMPPEPEIAFEKTSPEVYQRLLDWVDSKTLR